MPNERDDLKVVHERMPDGSTRVKLVRDGQEISGSFVVPMIVQIGIAPVRMDGIGGVATEEAYRNRGYSRRVLEACIDFMKQGDAPLTTLYGIPSFYPKFGYATLGPESSVELAASQIPEQLPEGFTARRMTPDDLPAVRSVYAAGMEESIGPLVRDGQALSWNRLVESLDKGEDEARVVLDAQGRVVAYAWRASWGWWMGYKQQTLPDALRIAEAIAVSPAAADALLALCRAWAAERGAANVQLMVPPDGTVATAAALRGATIRLDHTFEGEYMGRSLDVARLFVALRPELERRWARCVAPWLGRVVVDTGEDRVALTFTEESVAVGDAPAHADVTIRLTPGDVARLVFGGFPPEQVLARAGVTGPAASALAALFPQGFPYIYPPDRF